MDFREYAHSPVHVAVLRRDYAELRRIVGGAPRLARAGEVATEEQSEAAEAEAEAVAAVVDRRDVPGRETALHVAVRQGDAVAVELLMSAGADWSLQNAAGWNALQEAVCARRDALAAVMTRHYQPLAWAKWCRRLPRLVGTAARMRDFYMEMSFHFESSVIPFIARIAPSDTYRIWKRRANLRADMTLAGFDGFRIQRSDLSLVFLGHGAPAAAAAASSSNCVRVPAGSLLLLSHKEKEISNALEGAGCPPSDAEVAREVASMARTSLYRPGIDVTAAQLVPHLNWRRQERSESVGPWNAKVYDMLNVLLSVKSRRVPGAVPDSQLFSPDAADEEGEDDDEEYEESVYEGGVLSQEERRQLDQALNSSGSNNNNNNNNNDSDDESCASAAPASDPAAASSDGNGSVSKRGWFGRSKKASKASSQNQNHRAGSGSGSGSAELGSGDSKAKKSIGIASDKQQQQQQESEYKKGLRPVLWLTKDFPLKTEEFVPLLDILANKVKAIQRLRELLTTKLPPGTFPVKIAIPVVPTIRVVITVTKFEEFQPPEEFSTPPSSPDNFQDAKGKGDSTSSGSWMSWMKGSYHSTSSKSKSLEESLSDDFDPFHIPVDYRWVSMNEKKRRMKEKKMKAKKNNSQTADGLTTETNK